ncbi:MAG: hypothetical protein ACLFOY_17575 [Desulfatibacillaceae bacterium]
MAQDNSEKGVPVDPKFTMGAEAGEDVEEEFELEKFERIQHRITAQNVASLVILVLIVAAAGFFYVDFSKRMEQIQELGQTKVQDLSRDVGHVSETLMVKLESTKDLLDRDIENLHEAVVQTRQELVDLKKAQDALAERKVGPDYVNKAVGKAVQAETADLRGRLQGVEKQQDALAGELDNGISALSEKLAEETDSLRQRVDAVGSVASGFTSRLDEQKTLVAGLAQKVDEMDENKTDAAEVRSMLISQMGVIEERLARMEETIGKRLDSAESMIMSAESQIRALETGIKDLEKKVGARRAPATPSPPAPEADGSETEPATGSEGSAPSEKTGLKQETKTGSGGSTLKGIMEEDIR